MDLEELIRFGLSPADRTRLGLKPTAEPLETELFEDKEHKEVYADWLEDHNRMDEAEAVRKGNHHRGVV